MPEMRSHDDEIRASRPRRGENGWHRLTDGDVDVVWTLFHQRIGMLLDFSAQSRLMLGRCADEETIGPMRTTGKEN